MRETLLTVTGIVVTKPRSAVVDGELPVTSFRLASTSRRWDRQARGWVDGHTVWLTVTCWRQLARNVASSIVLKDRVVVHGRLRTPEWVTEGVRRSGVELDAESVGHDLAYGTTQFTRVRRVETVETSERRMAHELNRAVELDAMAADLGALLQSPADDVRDPDLEEADFEDGELEDAELVDAGFDPAGAAEGALAAPFVSAGTGRAGSAG